MQWIGVVRLFQWIHRKQIVILMVHGVMDDHDGMLWKPLRPQLPPARLDEYLKVLSKRYHFVSSADAVDMLEGRRPLESYSMVLTFDDGYRNNFTHALPILRRYHAPATFFVPTGFLDRPRPFWFDRLDYALQQAEVNDREVRIGSLVMPIDSSSREALQESFQRFRRAAKEQGTPDGEFLDAMEGLAAQLESESGRALADIQKDDDWSALLTWEQARRAGEESVQIGSHTVDHVRLNLVAPEVARNQLVRSKQQIETHTGQPCLSLCYPNGSFNEEIVRMAKESGYVCAVTTVEGFNQSGDDLMTLKRIALGPDLCSAGLLAQVSGLSWMVSRVRSSRFLRLLAVPAYVCRLVRSHGIRKAVARLGEETYSNKSYVITRRRPDAPEDADSDRMHCRIESLNVEDREGIEDVCRVWPAMWRSRHLKTKVIDDLKKGDVCLLMRSEPKGDVLGAVWLSSSDSVIDHCPIPHDANIAIIRSLFVIPEMRGRGLSKVLLRSATREARERGISQILAYTLPRRKASLRAQLSAGFQVVGTMKVRTRFGHTRYTFCPPAAVNNQQADLLGGP